MSSGTTETKSENKPLPEQYEQLKRYWSEAGRMYDQPLQDFPGSQVGQRDAASIRAGQMTEDLAGQEFKQSGYDFMGQVLDGDFMGGPGGNPTLDAKWSAMSDRIGESYNRITAPGDASRFAQAGRSNSMANVRSRGQNERNLGESLGRTQADIYYGDYNNRMQDRMSALGLMPSVASVGYQDIAENRKQGVIEEDYQQRLLNDQVRRFNFGQMEEEQRLDRFGQRVNSNNGWGTTTNQQPDNSGMAIGLGVLGAATTLAGSFAGPLGAAAGGMIGSQISGAGGTPAQGRNQGLFPF
jgi:hypothetical protein